jgi:hypothetical protein
MGLEADRVWFSRGGEWLLEAMRFSRWLLVPDMQGIEATFRT